MFVFRLIVGVLNLCYGGSLWIGFVLMLYVCVFWYFVGILVVVVCYSMVLLLRYWFGFVMALLDLLDLVFVARLMYGF